MSHTTPLAMKAATAILVIMTLLLVTVGFVAALHASPACAAPSPPRPPAVRAPSAPKAPAYRAPARHRQPAGRPTVYKTRYEHGRPVVDPVVLPVDDVDCD